MESQAGTTGLLALTGIEAAWGGCGEAVIPSAAAYGQMIYHGLQRFDFPTPGADLARAQADVIQAAARAIQDAGVQTLAGRSALVYGSDAALRLKCEWTDQVFDLSREENFMASALELAQRLFDDHDFVVIAAIGNAQVDLAAAARSETPAFGYDRAVHGWQFGWGAGAVVVTSPERARAAHRRVYAVIQGMASASAGEGAAARLPSAPKLAQVAACCLAALQQAGHRAEEIGYIEVFGCGSDAVDGAEIAGLRQGYADASNQLTTALGSGQANHGYLFSAAGLAGVVRAALCVYYRILPAAPGWNAPKLPALWRDTPFYIPVESRTWFTPSDGSGRLAGVNLIGKNGSFAHLVLGEDQRLGERPNFGLATGGFHLFPLVSVSLEDLLDQIGDLKSSLPLQTDLLAASAESYEQMLDQSSSHPGQKLYAAAILGHTHDELLREIDLALKAIPQCWEKGDDWQTPLGSCFSANPAGTQGSVALVYGGAFNSYPGVGKDLFYLCPPLYPYLSEHINDLGKVICEHLVYPRSLAVLNKEQQAAAEAALLDNPMAMLTSGSLIAVIFTTILAEIFKLKPAAAFGYSLGENSMMYALRVWEEGDEATQKLQKSPIFRQRLAGPQNAVREFWGLPPASGPGGEVIWHNYLVMAPFDAAQKAAAEEARVYLTHINTPRQVVIGGDPEGCKRVIARLNCSSIQAPFNYALHCDPIKSERDGLAALHHWPVQRVPAAVLYSADQYAPLEIEPTAENSDQLAVKIANMLCSPLDFPRLIHRVYEDGVRVFIEAGAGGNCARWIDESLKGKPHLALSINRRGTDDYTSLVRLAARLHCHRVEIDLSPLYLPSHTLMIQERVNL